MPKIANPRGYHPDRAEDPALAGRPADEDENPVRGYRVVIANKGFWQSLRVDATSEAEARAKVEAYLASPEHQRGEEEERRMAQQVNADADPADSTYAIDEVRELDHPTGCDQPSFVDAGGNG